MNNEAQVRDFFKDRLDLLEPDLTLVDVEAHVRDPNGSDGFVDILALDKRDYLVLIEVKRIRNAAREGLQELAKYAWLIAEQSGLSMTRLRCMVVSNDWHELHAAFSALEGTFPCKLTGYRYTLAAEGVPENIELVKPRPPVAAMSLCPNHFIVRVDSRKAIERKVRSANAVFKSVGIDDYAVFVFEREHMFELGKSEYLLYFVIQTITPDLTKAIAHEAETTIEADGTSTKFGQWEYAVFSLLANGHVRDDIDSGFAGTLVKMTMKYGLVEARKYGRLKQVPVAWTDDRLLREAIRCAYSDSKTDHPSPPDLLKNAQQHHEWDYDL